MRPIGMSARARVGLAVVACGTLAACAGTISDTTGGDCVSHYDVVARARTWSALKAVMLNYAEWGHVESVRTQARGDDVGGGDQDAVRVVDLLNRNGRRLVLSRHASPYACACAPPGA